MASAQKKVVVTFYMSLLILKRSAFCLRLLRPTRISGVC